MADEQRLLPDWIQAYMAYTAENRAPDQFHLWSALSCIAGAIQRKAFFSYEYFLVYPNLYVVLVGPPGRVKKSTAMRIGRGFLATIPEASFTSDSVTRERLILDMSQCLKDGHSSMTAYNSEFASFLANSTMDMVVFLTDIYDSPDEWSHRTKMGGTNKIVGPYLNIQAATTPDWLARSLPLDTVGIGFMARVLLIYADTPRKRPWLPHLSPDQHALQGLLVRDLQTISKIQGQFDFTDEALALYTKWYDDRPVDTNEIGDPRLNGYFDRKDIHLIKVAMLLSASRSSNRMIALEDIQLAFKLLSDAEPGMAKAFSAVGKNPLALDNEMVLGAIIQHPGIEISTLINMFRFTLRQGELEEVLQTLGIGRLIAVVQSETGPKYYPAPELANPDLDKDKPK